MSLRETPSQAADSQKEKKSENQYRDPPNETDSEQLNASETCFLEQSLFSIFAQSVLLLTTSRDPKIVGNLSCYANNERLCLFIAPSLFGQIQSSISQLSFGQTNP